MENDTSYPRFIIPPHKIHGVADGTPRWCYCSHDHFCWCFPGEPCRCFDIEENGFDIQENDATSIEVDAVENYGAGEELIYSDIKEYHVTENSAVEESACIATQNNVSISAEERDATEQHVGIREIPGVGRYRTERTRSDYNLCGMFALEISTYQQLGITLTQDDFMDILWHDPEMQDFSWKNNYQDVFNNFYDDQLAHVLQIWGHRKGLDNLQLGVIFEGSSPYILGAGDKLVIVTSEADMENERDFKTVWIYNDNAEGFWGAKMNHFSGITFLREGE